MNVPPGSVPVGIGLGSSEGDRLRNLHEASARLMKLPQVIADGLAASVLSAPVFETDPVGCVPGTAPFLNQPEGVVPYGSQW